MSSAFLGLGSNQGDRLENLRAAVALLDEHEVTVVRSSRVYETEPVGGPPQPDFLNAVVEVETGRDAYGLLDACLSIENALGRVRVERWGPRVVDLDILTFDDVVVDEPDLQIPHPRMHERGFVLIPLLELEANPQLPGGRRISSVRLGAGLLGDVRPYAPPLKGTS